MQRFITYLLPGLACLFSACLNAQAQTAACGAASHYFSRLSNAIAQQHIADISRLQTELSARCNVNNNTGLQPVADAATLFIAINQRSFNGVAESAATRLLAEDFGQISAVEQVVYYHLTAQYLLHTNQYKRALTLTHILSHELLEQLPPQQQATALLAVADIHFSIEFYQSVRELLAPLLQHNELYVRIRAATILWYAPQNQQQLTTVLATLTNYTSLPDTLVKVSALEVLARQAINEGRIPVAKQYLANAHAITQQLNATAATHRLWFIEASLPPGTSQVTASNALLALLPEVLSINQQQAQLDLQISQSKAANNWQLATQLLSQAREIARQIDRNKALAREYASFQMVAQAKAINQAKQDAQMQALAAQHQKHLQLIYILALVCAVLALSIVTLLWVRKRKDAVHFEHLANTDGLTKVLNRRAIQYYAEQALKRSKQSNQPFVIALADIDHFKSVNDTYGHDVGDIVLTTFARRAQSLIRQQDKLGRWGGEEWLIVMTDTTIDAVKGLFTRMQSEVKTVQTNEHDLTVTFSMGAVQGKASDSVEALINTADQRLYHAKKNGRNRLETGPDTF